MTKKPAVKKYILAMDIKTMSPLHITAIEKGSYNVDTRKILRYDGPGIGCSLTRTVSIASATRTGTNGQLYTPLVPTIPASTIAGKLRRAAANILFESLIARDLVLSADAYNVMTSGMATTSLAADNATPETSRVARQDPFLGLFGGTTFMLSSNCIIGEGWPLLRITKDFLMSEPIEAVQDFENLDEMTGAIPIIRKNDVSDMSGSNLSAVVGFQNLSDYIAAEGLKRSTSKAAKKDGVDAGKTDLRTFNAVEAVHTGIGFGLRIEVTSRSPAHLGLMLLAAQAVLQDGQFGGKGARGFGQVTCSASRLYELDPSRRQQTVVSNLFEGKNSGYDFCNDPVVQEAVMSAQDYADAVNPLLFEAFASGNAAVIKKLYAEVV